MCQFAVPLHWQLSAINVSLQCVIPVPTPACQHRSPICHSFHGRITNFTKQDPENTMPWASLSLYQPGFTLLLVIPTLGIDSNRCFHKLSLFINVHSGQSADSTVKIVQRDCQRQGFYSFFANTRARVKCRGILWPIKTLMQKNSFNLFPPRS